MASPLFVEGDESSPEDRVNYMYLNLVGQVVVAHLSDGAVMEGLFASCDESTGDIILAKSRLKTSKKHAGDAPADCRDRVRISGDEVVVLEAIDVTFRTQGAAMGSVDHLRRGMENFQKWSDVKEDDEFDDGAWVQGGWDQFKGNEKFGVKNTYKDELYTTKLDKSKFSRKQLEEAARMEREINSSATRGMQHAIERSGGPTEDYDEGELFSDVQRKQVSPPAPKSSATAASAPGGKKYVPPSQRGKGGEEEEPTEQQPTNQHHTEPSPDSTQGKSHASQSLNPVATPFTPGAGTGAPPESDHSMDPSPRAGFVENMLTSIARAIQEKMRTAQQEVLHHSIEWPSSGDDQFNDGAQDMHHQGGMHHHQDPNYYQDHQQGYSNPHHSGGNNGFGMFGHNNGMQQQQYGGHNHHTHHHSHHHSHHMQPQQQQFMPMNSNAFSNHQPPSNNQFGGGGGMGGSSGMGRGGMSHNHHQQPQPSHHQHHQPMHQGNMGDGGFQPQRTMRQGGVQQPVSQPTMQPPAPASETRQSGMARGRARGSQMAPPAPRSAEMEQQGQHQQHQQQQQQHMSGPPGSQPAGQRGRRGGQR